MLGGPTSSGWALFGARQLHTGKVKEHNSKPRGRSPPSRAEGLELERKGGFFHPLLKGGHGFCSRRNSATFRMALGTERGEEYLGLPFGWLSTARGDWAVTHSPHGIPAWLKARSTSSV